MKRCASKHGCYSIDPMPGQPQIALCHSLFVPVTLRGNGFGHRLKIEQMKVLVDQRYDFALCTVDSTNLAQKKVLTAAGWQRLGDFANSRSGGRTEIWGWQVTAGVAVHPD